MSESVEVLVSSCSSAGAGSSLLLSLSLPHAVKASIIPADSRSTTNFLKVLIIVTPI